MLRQLLRGNAALTRNERRLHHNGGRTTAGVCRQLRLFVWRAFLQLKRSGFTVMRDLLLACVVRLLLGHVPPVTDRYSPAWCACCSGTCRPLQTVTRLRGAPAARARAARYRPLLACVVRQLLGHVPPVTDRP